MRHSLTPRTLPLKVWGAALSLLLVGCGSPTPEPRRPLLILGVDGAEWQVIEDLWDRGELPHMRRLAAEGVRAPLASMRPSKSPVIWTTVATGMDPEVHGIRDMVATTDKGDVPVSTTMRRVAAIWNIASQMGLRVAVLGWWPSWPAEPVNGVVISDRAPTKLENRVYPPELTAEIDALLASRPPSASRRFGDSVSGRRDWLVSREAPRLAGAGFDLLMAYLKRPDRVSHRAWKFYQPERFPDVDAAAVAARSEEVPDAYRLVDEVIGQVLAAYPTTPNVLVVSDHGFRAARERQVLIFDLDALLAEMGLLVRGADGVDVERSQLYTLETHLAVNLKSLRFGSAADPERTPRRLLAEIEELRYASGEPVLTVPGPPRRRRGHPDADLHLEVLPRGATRELVYRGRRVVGVLRDIYSVSGTHSSREPGVFLAAGPDIDPQADVDGIRVHDITPTALYALGLPVAQDFAGRAWTELFRTEFRRRNPLRTIPSWGERPDEGPQATEIDAQLLDELRALGYLD